MLIKNTFAKDIYRPISGVVKADQQNAAVVWQELEEYVITRELDQHFRKFFEVYTACLKRGYDPREAEKIGVWISGWFGSGKSHFLKILSYLLHNKTVIDPETGASRQALQFFEGKLVDSMVWADVKLAAACPMDVILFNIGSKADSNEGRGAVLSVFWSVFNEMQGFSPDALHVAEMERFLTAKGRYQEFCRLFHQAAGSHWADERDAFHFHKDQVVQALSGALGQSLESAREWFEKAEDSFSFTVESFAKQVREYLDAKGREHRIVFLVDEVGQFIGDDGHLMLSLQTIVENLGTACQGRAWVVVTSQEDIEAVLGNLRIGRTNDFSKIKDRFPTRLSLSSTNTDEVITARLLAKTDPATRLLQGLFQDKGDILKNQLCFSQDSATLNNYRDAADFAADYPFAPYHFQIVQKIFESIRKTGFAGLSLGRGERSMLDAFQSAAKAVSDRDVGALAPLFAFYPTIESFLDTLIKLTIDKAKDNPGLTMPFDAHLLQTLFLIRHVEILKPNVENLTTLFVDQVDTDRLGLKRAVQEGLQRLEKETLINRNGDLYFFLTNEEREVGREIKSVEITAAEEVRFLQELLFVEILKDQKQHKHKEFKRDYAFNRLLDGHPFGSKVDQEMAVEFITPLHDEHTAFNSTKCIIHTSEQYGQALIKLDARRELIREVQAWVRTHKYIRAKSDASLSVNLKKILSDRQDENRERKTRIIGQLEEMILEADYYALGQTLEIKAAGPKAVIDEILAHLVRNLYNKFSYLASLHDDPAREIKATLLSGDVGRQQMQLAVVQVNPEAIREVREHVRLKTGMNHALTLADLAEHFGRRPYGWPEWETVLLAARLFMAGEIVLQVEGQPLEPREAVEPLQKSAKWRTVKIIKAVETSEEDLKKARASCQTLFGKIPPEGQGDLAKAIREGLAAWRSSLKEYKPLADTGDYPGKQEIDAGLEEIQKLLACRGVAELIALFNARRESLVDVADDVHTLTDFYANQRPVWERLRKALAIFRKNEAALAKDEDAAAALRRLGDVAKAPAPYDMLKDVDGLIVRVETVNETLLAQKREQAMLVVENRLAELAKALDAAKADADLRNQALYPLQEAKQYIAQESSIPGISYRLEESEQALDQALERIAAGPYPESPGGVEGARPEPKKLKTIKASTLAPSVYLDTPQDVERFVENLRAKLLAELKDNIRIRLT